MPKSSNSWLRVLIFLGAGIAVALQVGKVPPAIPAIQNELNISLTEIGWIMGIFSLIAASSAALIGLLADRVGQLRFVLCGMFLTASASFLGSFAPSSGMLIISRLFEGLGFLMTVAAVPSLIASAMTDERQKTAFALWGLYMPVGSFLMMIIAGPILEGFGWRPVWWIASIVILVAMVPVWWAGKPKANQDAIPKQKTSLRESFSVMRRSGPLTASAIFGLYAGLYMILTGFLPLILTQNDGFTLPMAASFGAAVVLFNAFGNAFSGWLHSKGFASSTLIMWAALGIGISGSIVFLTDTPVSLRIAAALFYGAIGGLIPSSLFASVMLIAPNKSSFATVNGMLAQGSAFGQLMGPPLVATLVSYFTSWTVTIPLVLLVSFACLVGGWHLRRFEGQTNPS